MPSDPLVPTPDRDALAQLQLFARKVVEGLAAGRHRSPHRGSSIEFKEHRAYAAGDEIKFIDWKLFGKTDRLYLRQYEDETNLRALILLDQSGSMSYRGTLSPAETKYDFARRLAACWATLLIAQQDAVGLATLDTQLRQFLPPRSNPRHLRALLSALVASQPGGETSLADALQQSAGRFQRRGLLVLISDCFDDVPRLLRALSFFQHAGHEVVVCQVWDRDELTFPFRRQTEFQGLETSATRRVDPHSIRRAYLQRVHEFRQQLAAGTQEARIEFFSCTTDQTCGQVLADFLSQRNAAGRRRPTQPKEQA